MAELNPVFLDLTGKAVLVVGGGSIAARKVTRLLEKGADVRVVAPAVSDEIKKLDSDSRLAIFERSYEKDDMRDCWLVFACTEKQSVNRAVFDGAAEARIWCNVVDQPDLCTFQVPAIVRQGLLQLAISTAGASPGFARKLRKHLEKQFTPVYDTLLTLMLDIRERLKKKYPGDQPRRQEILNSFLNSPELNRFLEHGDSETFTAELEQWKSQSLE